MGFELGAIEGFAIQACMLMPIVVVLKNILNKFFFFSILCQKTLKKNLENKEPAVLDFPKFSESKKLSSSSFLGKCQNNTRTSEASKNWWGS
jgi:hypothetical protein